MSNRIDRMSKCWICGGARRVLRHNNNTYEIRCRKCGRSIKSDTLIFAIRQWDNGDVNGRTNIKVLKAQSERTFMNRKLRKCDCCNEPPIHFVHREMGTHSMFCPVCSAMTPEFETIEDAESAWNCRHIAEPVPF